MIDLDPFEPEVLVHYPPAIYERRTGASPRARPAPLDWEKLFGRAAPVEIDGGSDEGRSLLLLADPAVAEGALGTAARPMTSFRKKGVRAGRRIQSGNFLRIAAPAPATPDPRRPARDPREFAGQEQSRGVDSGQW